MLHDSILMMYQLESMKHFQELYKKYVVWVRGDVIMVSHEEASDRTSRTLIVDDYCRS